VFIVIVTRRRTIALVLVALAAAPAETAQAQEGPRRVTLEEALALFARNNPELQVARAEAAEAAALARQVVAYPNPELGATHEPLSGDGRRYSESYLTVSQRLPWPAARSAREAAAERIATAAAARLAADSARLAFDVRSAWIEAALAERGEGLVARVAGVFREAERSAEERFREGDISAFERRRMAVERLRYENALADARLLSATTRRALALLVLPEGAELEAGPAGTLPPSPPPLDADRVAGDALRRRPEVIAARAELEAARAAARVARSGRVPEVTATGGWKRQSDGLAGALLGLTVPLPVWDRRAADVQAADARVAAAAARHARAERQVRNDVARALLAWEAAVARLALLGDPEAEAADLLAIAQVAYEAGEMELVQLLDAADALREAQALEARLRALIWTSYFDLERAAGGLDGATDNEEDA
jgi:outer membrane protein, heavy metal efflux system